MSLEELIVKLEEAVKKNTEFIARHILEHKTENERLTKLETLVMELMEEVFNK